MKVLDISHGRDKYEIVLLASPLWECALGIAVSTYPQIYDSLVAQPPRPERLRSELAYVEKHNTWYALLQLLHATSETELSGFLQRIERMFAEELKHTILPFLGAHLEDARQRAACGDEQAIAELLEATRGHQFFPRYIEFVANVPTEELRQHLLRVMNGWFEEIVAPDLDNLTGILQRDLADKQSMCARMEPDQFVEWCTGGIRYLPEPSVSRVLLIPHVIYRPWNVQGKIPGTQVYYYPVADESLTEETDPYRPPTMLVQTYKALGDENRMRIVKLLFEQDRTLQELTEQLDLAKSTIHHHLSLLRAAKLVKVEGVVYSLNHSMVQLADKQFLDYLERATR